MGDTRKVSLDFNTAITGLPETTGAWNDKVHNDQVLPLRGLIMQIDGVTGCFIARYAVEINYVPNVTDKATVVAATQAAIREVADKDGFFPLRGDKTPAAHVPEVIVQHDTWWLARVIFSTDLFAHTGKEAMTEIIDELKTHLGNADGVRKPGATQRALYVRFDRRQTTPESMTDHLKKVVEKLMNQRTEEKKYFPFAEPEFTYEVGATAYLI